MASSDFKTRHQIAELYKDIISYDRLKKLGQKGCFDGPPVIRKGRTVLYHVPTFEKWLLADLKHRDADDGPAQTVGKGNSSEGKPVSDALGDPSAPKPRRSYKAEQVKRRQTQKVRLSPLTQV